MVQADYFLSSVLDPTILSRCDKWDAILPEMYGLNSLHFGGFFFGTADRVISIDQDCGIDAIIVSLGRSPVAVFFAEPHERFRPATFEQL